MPVKFGISFNRPALNQAGALVHVYTDGSVTLNHGGTEMGQGLFIKVAQVVAEAFQIDIDMIRMTATTTGKVPNTSPTAASSGSDLNGMAALNAADADQAPHGRCRRRAFRRAEGRDRVRRQPHLCRQPHVSFAELARAVMGEARRRCRRPASTARRKSTGISTTSTGRPFYYFVYGIAAAEVAIDTLTGEMRVLRAELLQDCGQVAQSGDRSRPDRGRVRAGHGLAHQRGTVVGRRRPPAHARAVDLQNPRQPRRAAGLQRAHSRRMRRTARTRCSAPRRSASRR